MNYPGHHDLWTIERMIVKIFQKKYYVPVPKLQEVIVDADCNGAQFG